MKTVVNTIKTYLTNWKNLLIHSVLGVTMISIAIFAPISPYIRIGFIGVVVAFNILRMKYLDGEK
jgi:hypothetical protein